MVALTRKAVKERRHDSNHEAVCMVWYFPTQRVPQSTLEQTEGSEMLCLAIKAINEENPCLDAGQLRTCLTSAGHGATRFSIDGLAGRATGRLLSSHPCIAFGGARLNERRLMDLYRIWMRSDGWSVLALAIVTACELSDWHLSRPGKRGPLNRHWSKSSFLAPRRKEASHYHYCDQ